MGVCVDSFLFVVYRWYACCCRVRRIMVPLACKKNLAAKRRRVRKRVFSTTQCRRRRIRCRIALTRWGPRREIIDPFRASKIGPTRSLPESVYVPTVVRVRPTTTGDGVLAPSWAYRTTTLIAYFCQRSVGAAAAVVIWRRPRFGPASLLIDLDYSRAMEREADLYAIDLLRANGISTGSLATLFERMQAAHDKRSPKSDWPTYLSTHPPTPERVELFRTPAK